MAKLPLPLMLMSVVAMGCVAVALVAFLPMYFMSQKTTNEMGEELIDLSTSGSVNNLQHNMENAVTGVDLTDMVVDRSEGVVNQPKLITSFMALLEALSPKGVNYISFGDETGRFWGLELLPDSRVMFRVKNESYACRTEFNLPNRFDATNVTLVATGGLSCSYDPRKRSWYLKLNKTTVDLSAAYPYTSSADLAMTFGRQVSYPNGTVLGVVTTDVSAGSLSRMLHSATFGRTGSAFVVEVQTRTTLATSSLTPLLSNYVSGSGTATTDVTPIDALNTDYARTAVRLAGDLLHSSANVSSRVKRDGYWVSVRDMVETPSMHWRLVIVVPVSDYFNKVNRSRDMTVGIVVGMVVLVIAVAVLMLPLILVPLGVLRDRVQRVAELDITADEARSPKGRLVISEIDHLQERVDQLSNAMVSFTRYIPKEVVRDMLAAGRGVAELGMETTHLCVLFSDIVKFTAICESVTPEDLSGLLSAYFSRCVAILLRHNATVDKFIGDAIMAFWGAPIPNEHSEVWACLASVHMQAEIERQVQPVFAALGQRVATRIGINSGPALVGNIGSSERMSYTALGDTVNVAARLEGCNKLFNSGIMISSATREFISERNFLIRLLGRIRVVGREAPMPVYEVHGVLSDVFEGNVAQLGQNEGLSMSGGFMSSFSGVRDVNKQLSPGSNHLKVEAGDQHNMYASISQMSRSGLPQYADIASQMYTPSLNGTHVFSNNTSVSEAVAAVRRRRGAFNTIEEALKEVKQRQVRLSKLERSAVTAYHEGMMLYQRGPENVQQALLYFRKCREALIAAVPITNDESNNVPTEKSNAAAKVDASFEGNNYKYESCGAFPPLDSPSEEALPPMAKLAPKTPQQNVSRVVCLSNLDKVIDLCTRDKWLEIIEQTEK